MILCNVFFERSLLLVKHRTKLTLESGGRFCPVNFRFMSFQQKGVTDFLIALITFHFCMRVTYMSSQCTFQCESTLTIFTCKRCIFLVIFHYVLFQIRNVLVRFFAMLTFYALNRFVVWIMHSVAMHCQGATFREDFRTFVTFVFANFFIFRPRVDFICARWMFPAISII